MNFTAAGRLIHNCTLQQIVRQQSSSGGGAPTWRDIDEFWCEISPSRPRNIEIASAFTKGKAYSNEITSRPLRWEVPNCPDDFRVVYKNYTYNIFGVNDQLLMGREWLWIVNQKTG